MKIRKAKLLDCLPVAKIHRECLDKSFLATLGEKFLSNLYKALIEYESSILIVAEHDGKVVGFVSAAANTNDFYKYFLKKNFIKASFLLLPKVVNLTTFKKIFETLQYSKKKEINIPLPEAELLSIAVKENCQRKGIAKQLFEVLINEFHKMGINEFRIVVGSSLFKAKNFYQKMGCIKVGEFELHKGEKSEIYVFRRQ